MEYGNPFADYSFVILFQCSTWPAFRNTKSDGYINPPILVNSYETTKIDTDPRAMNEKKLSFGYS